MTDKTDRAFPSTFHNGYDEPERGMTLRDYFAAKAMQSLIEKSTGEDNEIFYAAEDAYFYADAMMKARVK